MEMGNEHRDLSLLTDLYELTMMQGYFKEGKESIAIFDAFYRKNPCGNGYAIACGLDQIIQYIKDLRFSYESVEYLRSLGIFEEDFLQYLSGFHFTGDIYAIPEGTVMFPYEPVIKVVAPILQAQLIEPAILNMMNHQSLIATKAARVCRAADGDGVMEFGLRRAQGADAGTYGARAAVIAGCVGTSNVLAGKKFGVPIWMLLGGKMRSSLRAYASQLQMGWGTGRQHCTSSDDYAKATRIAMDKGFDAVKINFTTFREDGTPYDKFEQAPYLTADYLDVIEERLKAVRDTLGPNGDIILENHSLTDKLSATQMGNMAKRYRIMYFEEPTAPHADNLAYVHEHTGIPVATGERMYSRWQFKDYLEKGAVQVIQPDLGTCGGITEVKKICDLAYIYEAAVQIHVCGSPLITAASLHMEAAIPGFIIHEYNVNTEMPRMLGLTTRTYEPVNGKMPVPDLPGIGNEIAPETFSHSEVIHVE